MTCFSYETINEFFKILSRLLFLSCPSFAEFFIFLSYCSSLIRPESYIRKIVNVWKHWYYSFESRSIYKDGWIVIMSERQYHLAQKICVKFQNSLRAFRFSNQRINEVHFKQEEMFDAVCHEKYYEFLEGNK